MLEIEAKNFMKQYVYLDHNATTPVLPEVASVISDTLALGGNASSVHSRGRLARQAIENARDKIANSIGVRASEVLFTSGGTEANNLILNACDWDHVMVTAVEHDSILNAGKNTEVIPVNKEGLIDLAGLEKRLGAADGKILVSVMLANNETGVIQPVAEVSRIAQKYGAMMHTDAIQACGKIQLDRSTLGVDFISLSAHKIGGPQGVGALIINEEVAFQPMIRGGGQERGRRSGTENISGISGFGVAVEAVTYLADIPRIKELRNVLEATIEGIAPGAVLCGEDVERLPNTSSIFMPGVNSETQVMKFDLSGIMISAGSACSSGKVEVSHVLKAMGIEDDIASNVIRVSLGVGNSISDVERFIQEWKKIFEGANAGNLMDVA